MPFIHHIHIVGVRSVVATSSRSPTLHICCVSPFLARCDASLLLPSSTPKHTSDLTQRSTAEHCRHIGAFLESLSVNPGLTFRPIHVMLPSLALYQYVPDQIRKILRTKCSNKADIILMFQVAHQTDQLVIISCHQTTHYVHSLETAVVRSARQAREASRMVATLLAQLSQHRPRLSCGQTLAAVASSSRARIARPESRGNS